MVSACGDFETSVSLPDNAVFACDAVACVVSCPAGFGSDKAARTTYDCTGGVWVKTDAVDLTCARKRLQAKPARLSTHTHTLFFPYLFPHLRRPCFEC